MSEQSRRVRPAIAIAAVLAFALVAALLWSGLGSDTRRGSRPVPGAAEPRVAAGAEVPPAAPHGADGAPAPDVSAAPPSGGEVDLLDDLTDPGSAWAAVDMEAVRAAMPDNLYWKMAMPTDDPDVLREREEERARWNVEYGKVLSNTATEDEIRDYYAFRHRLSSEYIEFATYLLDHYRNVIPERDVGMLELAVELHLARLEEIPRRQAEALERMRAHDAAREAWLADQARFEEPRGADGAPPRE